MSSERPGPLISVAPADAVSADAAAAVPGSTLDTGRYGQEYTAYRVQNVHGSNSVTVKLQASIDGVNWTDLRALQATGADHAADEVAVAAGANHVLIVTPGAGTGRVRSAYRYYRVSHRSTAGGSPGTTRLRGTAR